MVRKLKIPESSSSVSSTQIELFAKAIKPHQVGRMECVIELYRHFVFSVSGICPARNNLGVTLCVTDKFGAAVSALRWGTDLNDQDAGAWSNLGKALLSVGGYDEEARAHEKSLAVGSCS